MTLDDREPLPVIPINVVKVLLLASNATPILFIDVQLSIDGNRERTNEEHLTKECAMTTENSGKKSYFGSLQLFTIVSSCIRV